MSLSLRGRAKDIERRMGVRNDRDPGEVSGKEKDWDDQEAGQERGL